MHGAGIDPTPSRSAGECLVRTAIEALNIKEGKKQKLIDLKIIMEIDPTFWSHFLIPLFVPTYRGDLVKIGRE